MPTPDFTSGTIHTLVGQNFRLARALDSYGVNFFEHFDLSLQDLCREKGISMDSVLMQFEIQSNNQNPDLATINTYPVDMIISFLKHSHYLYIKGQLPYIRRLIERLKAESKIDADLISDLKFVFPLFLEDFIHHIYEEEDSLFSYILKLHQITVDHSFSGKVYFSMEKHSIQELAMEHNEDDDEMRGIRGIINQYDVEQLENVHLKVIFKELQSFDQELAIHARIEDEVLFPKALALEKKVREIYADKIKFN